MAAFVFAFGVVVYADEQLQYSSDVTVGQALTGTLYDVEISWGDLTFDWKYDHWEPANTCGEVKYVDGEIILGAGMSIPGNDEYGVYTDNKCTNMVESELKNGETYYINNLERDFVEITIVDKSINGQVAPQVRWGTNQKYDYYAKADIQVKDRVCHIITDEGMYNFVKEYGASFYSDSQCSESMLDNGYSSNKYYTSIKTWKYLGSDGIIEESARRPIYEDSCYTDTQGVEYCFESEGTDSVYDLRFSLSTDGYNLPSDSAELSNAGDSIGVLTILLN